LYARLEIFMVMKIQVMVFWVMTMGKDGGTMALQNIKILPHHYTVSKSRPS
jgi:hypothetical protein